MSVSALSPAPTATPAAPRHADHDAYKAFLRIRHRRSSGSVYTALAQRRHFVARYPDLDAWMRAPLAERVGRLAGELREQASYPVCYRARPYLYYLALSGHARFDWDWLIAVRQFDLWRLLAHHDDPLLDRGVDGLIAEALDLGYRCGYARDRLRHVVCRLVAHTGDLDVAHLTEAQITEFADALRRFRRRTDLATFFGSDDGFKVAFQPYWTGLHLLRIVLYHRGQIATEPHKYQPLEAPAPVVHARMEAVADRYLALRKMESRPSTLTSIRVALRRFIVWLTDAHPEVGSFADVTREHVLEYAAALDTMISVHTGQRLATTYKQGLLSGLSTFFRETAAWEWDEVPGRPLLGVGDLPKMPQRVPRYIPDHELARLMDAVRALPCPYRRAALLIARWSGARRGEIRRLVLDCLDAYPDGTPRLRIPAGKTYSERIIPLNEEAAAAIRTLQAERHSARGFRDELTGTLTRYLFVRRGTMISQAYLFETALDHACRAAGLLDDAGQPTVTAHRFRHTVGTQLAEGGATLHTIMRVLGHNSASMSMVYARISDREVLRDYRAVLEPGAAIAGPLAETVRAGALAPSAVEWLKTNFLKTELELGHCLRLPQEGPCECDLYLSCAKFVTTPAYAPRLRHRRRRELELIEDAHTRGWQREVERHRGTVARIERLLADLGEACEGPEESDDV